MKIKMSLSVLRWLIPVAKWALTNLEKKHFHSVDETEKLEALKHFIELSEKK